MQFSSLLQGYQGAEDLNASTQRRDRDRNDSPRRERSDSRPSRPPFDRGRGPSRDREDRSQDSETFSTFSINLGDMDNVNPARLMGLVNEQLQDRSVRFGKINIRRTHTMFELDQRYESQLLSAFDKLTLKGRNIEVSKANSDSEKRENKLKRKRKRK
jgi:ATP-dependent RNA helicase DeaD